MKLTAVAAPAEIVQPTSNTTEMKSRAVEAFMRGTATIPKASAPQEYPVADANNISAEELSAIKSPTTDDVKALDSNTTIEDTNVEEKIEPKTDKDLETEKKFAEIARQERILRAKAQKQAQDLKTQQEALDVQKAALDARTKELEQGYISKDKFKTDPLSALTEAELSYDELTQRILSQQPRDPRVDAEIKALRDELKSLRSSNEETSKAAKQHQTEQYQAAVLQIERDTNALIKADPVAFEAITKTGAVKDVVELIERTYREDGRLLSVQEAAQEVEDYLVEEGYNTFSKIDKIKKRLAESNASTAKTQVEEQKTQAKPAQTQPQMKTLTNAAASTRKLSSRERALLAFKGEKL